MSLEKRVPHVAEMVGIVLAYCLIKCLPLEVASNFGSAVARKIGPKTKVHQTAHFNLRTAMPDSAEEKYEEILRGMWDNLGRVFCEYPHLTSKKMRGYLNLTGREHVDAALASGRPIVCVAGHMANWEVVPLMAHYQGIQMHLLHCPPNNPLAQKFIDRLRGRYSIGHLSKGLRGARSVIEAVRKKEHIGILIDQKTNDGISVPFFRYEAMTTIVPATLALRYQAIILPVACERRDKHHFDIRVEAPFSIIQTGGDGVDSAAIMTLLNQRLEQWIVKKPEQWFWVHKHWPFSKGRVHD